MAKKTSTNAVRKIDEQIKNLETMNGEGRKREQTTTIKKSSTSTKKKTGSVRDKVVVTPSKKTATVKKTSSSSKNVRGDVVVAPTKNVRRNNTTKTVQRESLKNDIHNLKNKKEDVVVPSERKDLEAEVNKILEIEEPSPSFVPLDLRDEIVVPKDERETPKKKTTIKPISEKENSKKKAIVEEAPVKEELETKIHEFLEKEDRKEISTPSHESRLEDVDVIKFENTEKKPVKTTPKKKGNLKKKTPVRKAPEKKPIVLESNEKIEEFNIVEDEKKVSPPEEVKKVDSKKNDFKRKRKGKGYVVDIPKKPYKELESDLRSLYDRVNDVVDDFEGPGKGTIKKDVFQKDTKKKEKKASTFSLKSLFAKKKSPKPTPSVVKPISKPVQKPVTDSPRKVKVVKEVTVADSYDRPKERPSLLDHISQKVLNFFLAVLFTIFLLMVIAFIAFIIYVSTF